MEKQQTFASAAWSRKGKVTRRERFLAEMDAVIPWSRLVKLIAPHYPHSGKGRPPHDLERMLRDEVLGVASGLPALTRAAKLGRRAARVGFDWTDPTGVLTKVEEETGELRRSLAYGDAARVREELGDLLFAMAQLARHLGDDPEAALRAGNAKFERRFRWVELRLAEQGRSPADATMDELEALWSRAKQALG